MARSLRAMAAALLAVGVASQAHAAAFGFTGAVTVQIATIAPVILPGAGTAILNGSSGTGHLTQLTIPSGGFAITGVVVPVTDPAAFPIAGVQVTAANGTGSFGGSTNAAFGGKMPILGAAKVCLFGPCSAAIANLTVPLSNVGAGGTATVMGAVNLTVFGAPWTTGTVSVGAVTAMGGAGPTSAGGAPLGHVTLVTPIFISTNIGASAVIPAFGFMSLHLIPEPGTLALLGSGIAGLVALGRRRARR